MRRAFLLLHQAVGGLRLDLKSSNQAFKSRSKIFKLLHPGYNINNTATINTTLLIILDHITGPQLLNYPQSHLRLQSTISKHVKYIQAPVVYASNNSCSSRQFIYCRSCTSAHPLNPLAMIEALPYFEGRSLIFAANTRQGNHFFSVLMCCSTVYLAGQHVKKSRKLDLN